MHQDDEPRDERADRGDDQPAMAAHPRHGGILGARPTAANAIMRTA
jgi:hypothetical protein